MWNIKKTVYVADDEKLMMFEDRRLTAIYGPGKHRLKLGKKENTVEILSLSKEGITNKKLENWLKLKIFTNTVDTFEAQPGQVGLLKVDGKLEKILAPETRYVQWKDSYKIDVEWIDVSNISRLTSNLLMQLVAKKLVSEGKQSPVVMKTVPEGQAGLLFENGQLIDVLDKGLYGYWSFGRELSVQLCDLKQRLLEIGGQEMLTSDRLSLRMNVVAIYRVSDVRTAVQQLPNVGEYVYKMVQLALRETVGAMRLDELLSDKEKLSTRVFKQVAEKLGSNGLKIETIGIKDIVLPGEMKTLLNQVVQAQKSAEANIIKRREETAATRSLSNTARMLADNPTLMRLKELETLEKVVTNIDTLNVSGGLDSLMNELVSLRSNSAIKAKGG